MGCICKFLFDPGDECPRLLRSKHRSQGGDETRIDYNLFAPNLVEGDVIISHKPHCIKFPTYPVG